MRVPLPVDNNLLVGRKVLVCSIFPIPRVVADIEDEAPQRKVIEARA